MPEPIKVEGDGATEFKVDKATWDKTQEQISNLNKGIAVLRDEGQGWKKKFEDLDTKVNASGKDDTDTDEDVTLAPEDEKKLEAWAKKKGMVTAEELKSERVKIQAENQKNLEGQAIAEFLEKYPEFNKDEGWNKVLDQFQLYKTPTSLAGYRQVLGKIYGDLTGNPVKAKEDGRAEARAELRTKSRLSLGSGEGAGGAEGEANIDTLQKRYPNLSKEQIEERLSEIKALFPENK